jgi:homopolymeric O-antigen transport system ATP-binding protein
MTDIAISLSGVSKKYPIYDSPFQKLKEAVRIGDRRYHREFWALRDINLEIPQGVSLGILGQNGSGKTTLLQLIAGILEPTSGEIKTRGRISTILELGAGFDPDFTGRENAFLSGIILGLRPAEIKEKMGEITAFAEIGEFIDQPVKTYSSGMYVRLAFAVAVTLDPDVLLIDEVLAVGDAYFQHKCTRKIREFQERGKTMVYVTHDIESVSNICHQAIIIDYSHLLARGEPGDITSQYLALIDGREQEHAIMQTRDNRSDRIDITPGSGPESYSRYGSKEAEITSIEILDKDDSPRTHFMAGEEFTIKFHVYFHKDVDKFILGNIFKNKWGFNVFGTNNQWFGLPDINFRMGDNCVVTFHHRAEFATGTYSINPAASLATGRDTYRTLDWINNAEIIHIRNSRRISGYIELPTKIEIDRTGE